jgi:hypothetical protein
MILSMSCNLKTRRIVWTGRNNDDTILGNLHPLGNDSVSIAGKYAKKYKDEALEKIPTFE